MDETGLNYRLAEILSSKFGLDIEGERDVGFGKRVDILATVLGVGNNNVRIALEMEKHGTNKKREAVKDAASRIGVNPSVDLAIAAVYPKSCRVADDITPDTEITYLHVTKEDVRKFTRDNKHDHKRHADRRIWGRMTVKEIPAYVQNLHKDVGDPDVIASNLHERLDVAVLRLHTDDMKRLATALRFNYEGDNHKEEILKKHAKNGAKRALLVVAGAALFHTQLKDLDSRKPEHYTGPWPPQTLEQCRTSKKIRQDLIDAWRLILRVDYKSIFESAITVLESCTGSVFKDAITSMVEWAAITSDDIGGLRHDILGRIFHRVLDTAKQDGSFYTSTAAAAFLATLAIPKKQPLDDYRVVDPSCGTGTLLMAASERLRVTSHGTFNPTTLINKVIQGFDINTTACHMAATTLGLLSPDTNFDEMRMHALEFGKIRPGQYRAGSLELYKEEGLMPLTNWTGMGGSHIQTREGIKESMHGVFNLVIMNPPFTRNSLRHDQFTKEDEAGIKAREAYIFRNEPKGLRHSSDPMFMLLAERLLAENGTLAAIRPMAAATSAGSLMVRQFLAKHFHIETVVVSFDPNRRYFSENTTVNELLIVARRPKPEKDTPTRIVKLIVNPHSEADAIKYVEALHKEELTSYYKLQDNPQADTEDGNWYAAYFLSNHLVDVYRQIMGGDLFPICRMGDAANQRIDSRSVRLLFTRSDDPMDPSMIWPVKWSHNNEETKKMHAPTDSYLIRNEESTKRMTDDMWQIKAKHAYDNGGLLHVSETARLNKVEVFAVKTDTKSIGSKWHSFVPKSGSPETWSRAMTLYLNSTLGIMSLLGTRTFSILEYPRWGVDDIHKVPIPVFNNKTLKSLANTYAEYADADMGLLRYPSEVRSSIDQAVCDALKVSEQMVTHARFELAREPMVTARQYETASIV